MREEIKKIATMVIKTSMDSDQKIEAITDKITALIERESGWISVDNPVSGKTYIVWFVNEYGKKRVCNAIYYDKYYCEANDDTDQDDDWYDIKDGIYYIPKGWYEASEYHEIQIKIECCILGIMPLPNPPKSEEV